MTESVEVFHLRSFRGSSKGNLEGQKRAVKSPTIHIARGYEKIIPVLLEGRPIVCLSDWQCETSTQQYFWTQAWKILKQQVGCESSLERALVIVAGDMASKNNALRGPKSDAAPDYSWLQESFPLGDILIVYGNHDLMAQEHLELTNQSGLPCLLPHGSWVGVPAEGSRYNRVVSEAEFQALMNDETHSSNLITCPPKQVSQQSQIPVFLKNMTKEERAAYYAKQSFSQKVQKQKKPQKQNRGQQWDKDHPEQARLAACYRQLQSQIQVNTAKEEGSSSSAPRRLLVRVGSVHGIPSAFHEGIKKVEREEYFLALAQACQSPIDILVTHYQPCLPGTENFVHGDDPKRLYEYFMKSSAYLHVCGHRHLEPPITVLANNDISKVVVNADCRVVVFVPPAADSVR